MICPSCATENREGARFCASCGSSLSATCPACGTAYQPSDRFCVSCGHGLAGADERAPAVAAHTARPPGDGSAGAPAAGTGPAVAERRLVSILFADLVGFTTLSEERDPEDTRELLSRYFDTAGAIIERYGGTVEKFIGDAVMALWGAPTAHEDDAERAVRAALELVDAVASLGETASGGELQLRAGVLTGEAAVTLGATNQGLVAGDLVNTASRLQSVALPGTVLVGDTTRRASEPAIVYEPAGEQTLKGKAAPVPAFRALRVISGRGGSLRFEGLEPPFVGRDREMRLVKELLNATADDRKAHLVSVTGIAGIGKSRLAWELLKYVDGVSGDFFWHQGRCLAYGDGVTYWALAEMIRMRAGIAEAEEPASAISKLQAMTQEHLPEPGERRWIERRLAQLLGLEEATSGDRQDLFAAWRLFFERLAAENPTILVFEDMQWADPALVEFLEHLLEWSRSFPIFVLSLSRPEVSERHPGWDSGKRNFTSLYLEPLAPNPMRQLLDGLAPGLPDSLTEAILSRAEGVPMYAVETVRMLIDRGLLVRDGSVYRPTAEIAELEVPETLHALIAARLDAVLPDERELLANAAILGRTFTREGLAALGGRPPEEVDRLLTGLVRKEILSVEADPRSPERGQYGFLQDLVRAVAYDTLPRRARRAKHLAVAAYLEASRGPDDDEIAEVLAAHYLDADRMGPDADDAEHVRGQARAWLSRAGDRAASLGANESAQRLFEHAAELSSDPAEAGRLYARIGEIAERRMAVNDVVPAFERAAELLERAGLVREAALAQIRRVANVATTWEDFEAKLSLAEDAWSKVRDGEPSVDLVHVGANLVGGYFFTGRWDRAMELADEVSRKAEALGAPPALIRAFSTRSMILRRAARPQEALALLRAAVDMAREQMDLPSEAAALFVNYGDTLLGLDRYAETLDVYAEGLRLARRYGDRPRSWFLLSELTFPLLMLGRWDEALARAAEIPPEGLRTQLTVIETIGEIHIARGEPDKAEELLSQVSRYHDSPDFQERGVWTAAQGRLLNALGKPSEALALVEPILFGERVDLHDQAVRGAFVIGAEAALALREREAVARVTALAESAPPGLRPRSMGAHLARFRARLAALDGADAEADFVTAERDLEALSLPFWLAVSRLEHAAWLAATGASEKAAALLDQATETFVALKAAPWLERAQQVAVGHTPVHPLDG